MNKNNYVILLIPERLCDMKKLSLFITFLMLGGLLYSSEEVAPKRLRIENAQQFEGLQAQNDCDHSGLRFQCYMHPAFIGVCYYSRFQHVGYPRTYIKRKYIEPTQSNLMPSREEILIAEFLAGVSTAIPGSSRTTGRSESFDSTDGL